MWRRWLREWLGRGADEQPEAAPSPAEVRHVLINGDQYVRYLQQFSPLELAGVGPMSLERMDPQDRELVYRWAKYGGAVPAVVQRHYAAVARGGQA